MRWLWLVILFIFAPGLVCGALGLGLTFILPLLYGALFFPLVLQDTGTVRYRSIPWMTVLLIIINVILFLFWQGYLKVITAAMSGTESEAYDAAYVFYEHLWTYGTRNIYFQKGYGIGAFSTFTSMFMHGDHVHLIGNMLYLWAFGRRIEDACGSWRYLVFYLFAGMVGNIGSALLTPASAYVYDVPGVGASGAIAGLMGAYLLLFPTAWVNCLWGIGIFPLRPLIMFVGYALELDNYKPFRWTINLPAFLLVGFFAVNNILPGFEIIQGSDFPNAGGTLAHMTGLLAGIGIFLFVRKDLALRYFAGRRI